MLWLPLLSLAYTHQDRRPTPLALASRQWHLFPTGREPPEGSLPEKAVWATRSGQCWEIKLAPF